MFGASPSQRRCRSFRHAALPDACWHRQCPRRFTAMGRPRRRNLETLRRSRSLRARRLCQTSRFRRVRCRPRTARCCPMIRSMRTARAVQIQRPTAAMRMRVLRQVPRQTLVAARAVVPTASRSRHQSSSHRTRHQRRSRLRRSRLRSRWTHRLTTSQRLQTSAPVARAVSSIGRRTPPSSITPGTSIQAPPTSTAAATQLIKLPHAERSFSFTCFDGELVARTPLWGHSQCVHIRKHRVSAHEISTHHRRPAPLARQAFRPRGVEMHVVETRQHDSLAIACSGEHRISPNP